MPLERSTDVHPTGADEGDRTGTHAQHAGDRAHRRQARSRRQPPVAYGAGNLARHIARSRCGNFAPKKRDVHSSAVHPNAFCCTAAQIFPFVRAPDKRGLAIHRVARGGAAHRATFRNEVPECAVLTEHNNRRRCEHICPPRYRVSSAASLELRAFSRRAAVWQMPKPRTV
jgi:hypothetical protein